MRSPKSNYYYKDYKMITKYKTRGGLYPEAKITPVEVLRETEQCVFTEADPKVWKKGERKEAKVSEWEQYHDTWEDAHSALTRRAQEMVMHARRQLELANAFAGNVKGMKEPI